MVEKQCAVWACERVFLWIDLWFEKIDFIFFIFFPSKKIPQQQVGRKWPAKLSSPCWNTFIDRSAEHTFCFDFAHAGLYSGIHLLYKFLKQLQGHIGPICNHQAETLIFRRFDVSQRWRGFDVSSEMKGSPRPTLLTSNSPSSALTASPIPVQLTATAARAELDFPLLHIVYFLFLLLLLVVVFLAADPALLQAWLLMYEQNGSIWFCH